MEAFTSGNVSAAARRSYVADNPTMAEAFTPIRGGFRMAAWESQIAMARAHGRGTRMGAGKPIHPYDEKVSR